MEVWSYSQTKACKLFAINRTTFRNKPKLRAINQEISNLLTDLANNHNRWGFKLMFKWMRRKGYKWNHKQVYKTYCSLGLNLRIKPRKRLPSRTPTPCINLVNQIYFGR